MPYYAIAFVSIVIFSLVHLWAGKIRRLTNSFTAYFLSFGGGVSISYVFIDLLPKLAKNDQLVSQKLFEIFPYFERHVYIFALLGFLLFFVVDRSKSILEGKGVFILSLSSYCLFNFMIGYAIVDENNPEIKPIALFTIAMTLHYFITDYSLSKEHDADYRQLGKWLLITNLLLGWCAGVLMTLSATAIALVSAFIGGGMVMNVTRHELPVNNPHNLGAFFIATAFYTVILLALGS